MSNVGQTEKGVDAPKDLDDSSIEMLTIEQMRGAYQDMTDAKMSLNEKATVEGVTVEIQVLKQQLEKTHEQLRHLIGLYGTLQGRFDQFQTQRVKELNVRINGGSTSPEDMDGDID